MNKVPVHLKFVLLLGLVAAACTGSDDDVQAAEGSFQAQIFEYNELASDPILLRQNHIQAQEIVLECMREQGMQWEPSEVPPTSWWEERAEFAWLASPDHLYTMTDEQAAAAGFGVSIGYEAELTGQLWDPFPEPELDGSPGVTSDEEVELSTALVGLEGAKEGCIEQAEKKVLISPPVADHEFEHAFERLAGTAEFDDAMDSWSRCMNGQGYELGDVLAPGFIPEAFFGYVSESHGFDVEGLFSDPSPKGFQELREIEIEVASASVACLDDKRDTLLGSWSEIMGEPIG